MCDFKDVSRGLANQLNKFNKNPMEIYREQFQYLNLSIIKPGHCLATGKLLAKSEMYPKGKAPRHMTKEAYEYIVYRDNPGICIMCQGPNTNYDKLDNPRDIRWHYCHECDPLHVLLAGIVHEVPEVIELFQRFTAQPRSLKDLSAQIKIIPNQAPKQIAFNPQQNFNSFMGLSPNKYKVPAEEFALPIENTGWLKKIN